MILSSEVLFLFVGQSVDGVVDGEDVLGVKRVFHVLHEIDCHGRHDLLHEPLSNLANTMVMGKTTTLLKALVPTFVLNILIYLDHLVFRDVRVCIVVTKVYINGGPGLIDLCHTERNEHTVLLNTTLCTSLIKTLSHL